jgi:hypothetical protein
LGLNKSNVLHFLTKRGGRVVNSPASYSGGPAFKSRPQVWLSDLRFLVAFLSPSRLMPGYYLKLGHDRFVPNPFLFTLSFDPIIIVCVTEKSSLNVLHVNEWFPNMLYYAKKNRPVTCVLFSVNQMFVLWVVCRVLGGLTSKWQVTDMCTFTWGILLRQKIWLCSDTFERILQQLCYSLDPQRALSK